MCGSKSTSKLSRDFHGSWLSDHNGKASRRCSDSQEVSSGSQIELELQNEHNFAESLIEAAHVIVLVLDSEGRIVRFNSYMERLCGYTLEEVRGKDWFDTFLPTNDQTPIRELFSQAVGGAHTSGNVNPILTKDGQLRLIEWYDNTLSNADGDVIGIVAVGQDITEAKHAEQALRESEALLTEVGNIAKIGGWEMDLITRTAQWTRATYDIAEIEPGKPIPGPDDHVDYYFPEFRTLVAESMQALIEENKPLEFEAKLRTARGNVKWCRALGRAIRKNGRCVRVYGTLQDITERMRAREALQRAYNELETRVEARTADIRAAAEREAELQAQLARIGRLHTMGEMASGLAHELNQPMAAIVLEIEAVLQKVLSEGQKVPQQFVKSLEFVAGQAHRAGDLVRRMREFVKHNTPNRTALVFAEVVEEVLVFAQRGMRESDAVLSLQITPPSVEILADKVQLQQVLLNLILNAIEAMDTTDTDHRKLEIEAVVRGEFVEISVRDGGGGLPRDKIGRMDELFGPFFSTKQEGMGMGLAICRSIIESHGGRIWAQQNPDRGATFTFTLPIAHKEGEV